MYIVISSINNLCSYFHCHALAFDTRHSLLIPLSSIASPFPLQNRWTGGEQHGSHGVVEGTAVGLLTEAEQPGAHAATDAQHAGRAER